MARPGAASRMLFSCPRAAPTRPLHHLHGRPRRREINASRAVCRRVQGPVGHAASRPDPGWLACLCPPCLRRGHAWPGQSRDRGRRGRGRSIHRARGEAEERAPSRAPSRAADLAPVGWHRARRQVPTVAWAVGCVAWRVFQWQRESAADRSVAADCAAAGPSTMGVWGCIGVGGCAGVLSQAHSASRHATSQSTCDPLRHRTSCRGGSHAASAFMPGLRRNG